MRMTGLLIGSALLLAATVSATAHAQESPCSADIKKFCADVKPGGGRIIACLKQHEADVSPGCKQAQSGAHAQGAHFKPPGAACKADVQKFCKDVQPGGGRLAKCLDEHASDLSAECKADRKHE